MRLARVESRSLGGDCMDALARGARLRIQLPYAFRHFSEARARSRTRANGRKVLADHSAEKEVGFEVSPWPELDLDFAYKKGKSTRLRQHVNPLRAEYQVPRDAPDWKRIYEDCQLPLALDVGCAAGRFVLALAHRKREYNFLGLDIRHPLIDRANEWAKGLDLDTRVHFEFANATVSMDSMLSTYPGPITMTTIQFPDPHFKKRHKKRRVVQPRLIAALAKLMPTEGRVFLQSDVEAVTAAMRDEFEEFGSEHFALSAEHSVCSTFPALPAKLSGILPQEGVMALQGSGPRAVSDESFEASREDICPNGNRQWHQGGYLVDNPLGVPTEREVQTLKNGGKIYRVLLARK